MSVDRDLYFVVAKGHSLMVTTLPQKPVGDPRAQIALELGLIAQDVLLYKMGPCNIGYSLNPFLEAQFGIKLATFGSAIEAYWEGPPFTCVPAVWEKDE